jgi:hypothetical protein
MLVQNDSASTRTTGGIGGYVEQTNIQANGGSLTTAFYSAFLAQPTFNRINSGTLSIPVADVFYSQAPTIGAGTTVTQYNHFTAANATNSGTLTTQVGLNIGSLTTATNNTHVLIGTATTGNWGIYQSTSTGNYLGGKLTLADEIEIDGALNHDGTTLGVYGATPVAQSTDWNVIGDLTERKTLDLTSVSLTELAEYVATLTKKLREYEGNGILGAGYVPPDIGWSYFWTAETMTGGGASATDWTPVKGDVTLTRAGTSTVETDASFGTKNWIDMDAVGDYFYSPDVTMTQDYVVVAYIRMTGVPTNANAQIFDSYTDGTAPANRVYAYYQDTILDQQRMSAGTIIDANWASDYTTKLWELCFAGASSYWKRDGVTTVSGNANTNSTDGFVLGARYDLTGNQNDKIEVCYVGLISKTNWDAGRAEFVSWHNNRYTENAA